jgi:putative hemolysin
MPESQFYIFTPAEGDFTTPPLAHDDTPAATVTCYLCGTEHREGSDYYRMGRPYVFGARRNEEHPLCVGDCSFECADCSTVHSDDAERHYNTNDDRVCPRCGEHYSRCDTCRRTLHNDDVQYDEDDEVYRCSSCHEENSRRIIHNYSYRPRRLNFLRGANDATNKLFLGWELEVDRETPSNDTEADVDYAGMANSDEVYCKHDGSLCYGFEVVSHPGTWSYWSTISRLPWMEKLQSRGYRSYQTETCGMHVHVSRSALTELDIFKLLQFFKCNVQFIANVSRRKMENLHRWARVDTTSDVRRLIFKIKAGPSHRYEALNLEPEKTVEFRLFRGTLNRRGFLCNLAFVVMLVSYVKAHGMAEMNARQFMEWCRTNAKRVLNNGTIAKHFNTWIARQL